MNKHITKIKNQRGSAIMYVLMISLMGAVLGSALLSQTSSSKRMLATLQRKNLKEQTLKTLESLLFDFESCSGIFSGENPPSVSADTYLNLKALLSPGTDSFLNVYDTSSSNNFITGIKFKSLVFKHDTYKNLSADLEEAHPGASGQSSKRIQMDAVFEIKTSVSSTPFPMSESYYFVYTVNSGTGKIQSCIATKVENAKKFCDKMTAKQPADSWDSWDSSAGVDKCSRPRICAAIGISGTAGCP